jgi:hypothetical protein
MTPYIAPTTYAPEVQSVPPNHISSGGIAGWNEGGFFEGEEGVWSF